MINIFSTPQNTVRNLAQFIVDSLNSNSNDKNKFTIALSGGNTPKLLFEVISNDFNDKTDWKKVDFFWGDERCVDPESQESNYGSAKKIFLDPLKIPKENIHRIKGENDPLIETERYSNEINLAVKGINGLPSFDLIILGLGGDGHTASIFPDQMELLTINKICEIAYQPETKQKRITVTGKVINNAKNIVFLITGNEKADIVSKVINKKENYLNFPAAHIKSEYGDLIFYLDYEASKIL